MRAAEAARRSIDAKTLAAAGADDSHRLGRSNAATAGAGTRRRSTSRKSGPRRCRSFAASGRRPASATKSSRSSRGRRSTRWMRGRSRMSASRHWTPTACRRRRIVTPAALSSGSRAFSRGRVGVFPRDAAERRLGGAALAPHRRRACAAGGRWPQGRRADGQSAARQRRCADHVRPGDRARAAADALVRAVHAGAGRSDAAQPDRSTWRRASRACGRSMGITSSPFVPAAERIRGRGGEDRRVSRASGPGRCRRPSRRRRC